MPRRLPPLENLPGKLGVLSNPLDERVKNEKRLFKFDGNNKINPLPTSGSLAALVDHDSNEFPKEISPTPSTSNLCQNRLRAFFRRNISRSCKLLKHLGPVIGLFVYTVIGAAIFQELELKNEIAQDKINKEKFLGLIANICSIIITNNYNVTNRTTVHATLDYSNNNWSSCVSSVEPILSTYMKGFLKKGFDGELRNWDFEGAAFFAITVYTTIGYGVITPVTMYGRIATIIYAMIGIPLNFFVLADLGIHLNKILRHLWRKGYIIIEKAKMKRNKTDEATNQQTLKQKSKKRTLPVWIPLLAAYSYLFIGAAIFMHVEPSWNFLTSLYFCFQTFATIGFGDVIPDNRDNMMSSTVYILVGMALLSMCMAVITDNIKKRYAKYSKHLDVVEEKVAPVIDTSTMNNDEKDTKITMVDKETEENNIVPNEKANDDKIYDAKEQEEQKENAEEEGTGINVAVYVKSKADEAMDWHSIDDDFDPENFLDSNEENKLGIHETAHVENVTEGENGCQTGNNTVQNIIEKNCVDGVTYNYE